MTFEEWEEKYQPIKNPIDSNASFDGMMFETYGEEFEAVKAADPAFVWTWLDDGEFSTITNGLEMVNRMGYFIASNPYDETEPFTEISLDED
jgi:hypothetical protein